MRAPRPERPPLVLLLALAITAAACGGASDPSSGTSTGGAGGVIATGGAAPTGGLYPTGGGGNGGATPLGGGATGGATSGGGPPASGGTLPSGGAAPTGGGGGVTGGTLTGGTLTGGALTGGAAGGDGSGGATDGGEAPGGATSGGAGGAPGGTTTSGVDGGGGGATAGGAGGGGGVAAGGAGGGGGASGPCEVGVAYPAPDLAVTPTLVHDGGSNGLFEGVVWVDELGVLLFSDLTWQGSIPPSTVRRLTPPSTVTVLLQSAGTNGLAHAPDGTVIGAAHDVQGLVRIDPVTAERTVWVDNYLGGSFNSPNDLTVRSDGRVYFSDPDFQLGDRQSETGMTGVYTVARDGTVTLIDDTLGNPNGVALSPDEAWLYVDDEAGDVWRYPLDGLGLAGAREPFATVSGPADGMAIDCAGNLYVASHLQPDGRVNVLAPDGTALGSFTTAAQTTNLAFGGTDHRTLYVSAGRALYAVAMNLPGYPQ